MNETGFGWGRIGCAAVFVLALAMGVARAGTDETAGPTVLSSNDGIFASWLKMVSENQAEQPHWVTPLVTVTPRLEQEVRYDQFWESSPRNRTLNSYGGGKGLEFIPADNIEVILGVPAYQTRGTPQQGTGGFGDENLLFKYRILSANEEHGDYILTAFLGVTLPTGDDFNTGHHEVTTPTIAYGKGWGDFDVQSTLGISVPDNGAPRDGAGTPVMWNTAFQYRFFKFMSPELEFNYTYWPNGDREHLSQLYITPGIVLGKFDIHKRLGFTIGAGYQIAVTQNPVYNNNAILSVRFPF